MAYYTILNILFHEIFYHWSIFGKILNPRGRWIGSAILDLFLFKSNIKGAMSQSSQETGTEHGMEVQQLN